MKNFFLKVKCVLLVMLAMMGIHAQAQDAVTVEGKAVPVANVQAVEVTDAPGVTYSGKTAEFSVAAVCEALGIESIKDAAEYIVNPTTWECVENTSDGWRNGAGDLCGWSDITEETRGYCVKIQEPESGLIDYLGAHHNGVWNLGDVFTAYWGFVANNKASLVKVVVSIEEPSVVLEGQKITIADTQYVEVSDTAGVQYAGLTATFDVAKVCEALGIDSIADAQQYILNLTTMEAVENTTDGWRNGDGDALDWGKITEQTRGYCVKISDPASGVIDYLGAHGNGVWNADEWFVGSWVFVANGKAYIVEVDVHFASGSNLPVIDLPEPETDIAKLQLVGNASVSLERYYTQGYEISDVAVKASDIAAAFGLTKEELAGSFNKMIYVDQYNEGTNTGVLNLLSTTDGWLRTYINKDTDEMTDEVIGGSYSDACSFYIHDMAYNHETDEVTFTLGQYPGVLSAGDVRFVNLYVVYGDKAYVIKCTVNFSEPPYNGLDAMTKVGSETITLTMEPKTDYSYTSFTLNLENIAELLGAENTADIQMQGLTEQGGLSNDHTANNGGWWLDAAGTVKVYPGSFFIEPAANNTWTEFHVGQMPNTNEGGEEYTAKLYLTYMSNYYEVVVNLKITEKQEIVDPDELHVVATRTITINQTQNNDYAWSEGVVVPYEVIEEAIGTTDVHLYALALESTEEDPVYTDEYSCDPKPGFWCLSDGRATTWGNSSVWGMSIVRQNSADGVVFNCIQYPGLTATGETYNGSYFLANPENGAMLQVNIVYNIVESIEELEVVGEESVVLMASDDEFKLEVKLEEIATLLGFETADELIGADCMRALNEAGVYDAPVVPSNGLLLDDNGFVVVEGNVGIYVDGSSLCTYCNEDAPTNWSVKTDICFQNEGKQYIFHVVLTSADKYEEAVAIKQVAGNTAAKLFDLQGRQVSRAQKGIFILNGKKVVK